MGGLTLALVYVAAAGLLVVIQWSGASEMGSATIKGLIKFRIRRECCIATDGLSVVLCTDSISCM